MAKSTRPSLACNVCYALGGKATQDLQNIEAAGSVWRDEAVGAKGPLDLNKLWNNKNMFGEILDYCDY